MSSDLVNIVKKELKEILRDPRLFLGMILVPILMFPIMGIVINSTIEQAQTTVTQKVNVAFLNLDEGNFSRVVLSSDGFKAGLVYYNITLINLTDLSINNRSMALNYIRENDNVSGLIVIPENFTASINSQIPSKIEVYLKMRGTSFSMESTRIMSFVSYLNDYISSYLIYSLNNNVDPNFVKNPVVPKANTLYEGKLIEGVLPEQIQSALMMQLFILPLAGFMLIAIAVQFAATSVASEKEQKTLETLLTLPVKRTTLIVGKLTGSFIVAVAGAIGYVIGLQYYMNTITAPTNVQQINLSELGLGITIEGYVLLTLSMMLSIFTTLALVMILASLADDVRTAQSLSGIILLPVFLGGLIGMFSILFSATGTSLVTDVLLYIPFTNPVIAAFYITSRNYIPVILSLLALIIETLISIKIAARFYSSELILSLKLTFGKKRAKKKENQEETL